VDALKVFPKLNPFYQKAMINFKILIPISILIEWYIAKANTFFDVYHDEDMGPFKVPLRIYGRH